MLSRMLCITYTIKYTNAIITITYNKYR